MTFLEVFLHVLEQVIIEFAQSPNYRTLKKARKYSADVGKFAYLKRLQKFNIARPNIVPHARSCRDLFFHGLLIRVDNSGDRLCMPDISVVGLQNSGRSRR